MRRRAIRERVSVAAACLVFLVVALVAASPVLAQASGGSAAVQKGTVQPRTDRVPPEKCESATPPQPSPEEQQRLEKALERTHLPGPPLPPGTRKGPLFPPSPPTPLPGATEAADDFVVFQEDILYPSVTPMSSVTNEPSVAQTHDLVFYAGNWYAALSTDGGVNFQYVDPFVGPFPPVNDGFCCDQVTIYDPSRDAIFWLQQYSFDGTGNTHRINVDRDADGQFDCAYDFTPQDFGRPNGEWLDFPDLVLGANFLYHTTNVFDRYSFWAASLIARYPLDQIAECVPVGFEYYLTTERFSFRATHGAGSVVYWGTHNSTSSIRVYRWAEGEHEVHWDDRDVSSWTEVTKDYRATCPSPDGREFCKRVDSRILGAWVGDGTIGFMWVPAQDAWYPYPYTRVARFRESDRELIAEDWIWNPHFAWIYPAVAPNARGDVGGVFLINGGGTYPSCAAWIADDVNGRSFAPLDYRIVKSSFSGSESGKSGDYLTARPHHPRSYTWVAGCYGLRNDGSEGDPRFIWFGRERDRDNSPPVADAGPDQHLECAGPAGTPATLDGSGSTDPDGDELTWRWTGPFFENGGVADGMNPTVTFPVGDHTVLLTVEDTRGGTDTDTTGIFVADTLPPTGSITYPPGGACFGPAGVTVQDDFTDTCDDSLARTWDPGPGPHYATHGDWDVTLTVTDDAGNAATDTVSFTVDTRPPTVTLTGGNLAVPTPMAPMTLFFTSSDDDGAAGGVVHERVLVDGCVLYDGDSYGDGDGLLSDEDLETTQEEMCRLADQCGVGMVVDPVVRVEATDCGGNVGSAERMIPGSLKLRPGICP